MDNVYTGSRGNSIRILADSISVNTNQRILSYEVEFPRWILAEFNTHKMLEKNAASSRAIPVKKVIETVINNPAKPVIWGAEQSGMQSEGVLDKTLSLSADHVWGLAAKSAAGFAEMLTKVGLHKQWTNRLIENFTMTKMVVTATEWDNFFWLRCHCYSDDTEVMTSRGWRLISDVSVGDLVYTLNQDTKMVEYEAVTDTFNRKSDGRAVSIKGQTVDLLVSDEHRQVVVNDDGTLGIVLAKDLVGRNPRLIKNASITDIADKDSIEYARGMVLGFYLGNGWKYFNNTSKNSGIVVCKGGNHGERVIDDFITTAKLVYPNLSVKKYVKHDVWHCGIDGREVYEEFKNYANANGKRLAEDFFDVSCISMKTGVFDGLMLSDSNILNQSGGLKYYTSSVELANDLQRLCLELGVSATIGTDNRVGNVGSGIDSCGNDYRIENKSVGYRVSINLHRNTPKLHRSPEFVDYDGRFVCLSVEKNKNLYVRRNGRAVWSGNCDAQPDFKELATLMWNARNNSTPVLMNVGHYHTPYVENRIDSKGVQRFFSNGGEVSLEDALKISASCCAQVSYRVLDDDMGKAERLFGMLMGGEVKHSSPTGHQAVVPREFSLDSLIYVKAQEGVTHYRVDDFMIGSGNLYGWIQHRHLIKGNTCHKYNGEWD